MISGISTSPSSSVVLPPTGAKNVGAEAAGVVTLDGPVAPGACARFEVSQGVDYNAKWKKSNSSWNECSKHNREQELNISLRTHPRWHRHWWTDGLEWRRWRRRWLTRRHHERADTHRELHKKGEHECKYEYTTPFVKTLINSFLAHVPLHDCSIFQ